jgi:hypothetical protein
MRATLRVKVRFAFIAISSLLFTLSILSCTKEKVIIYGELPPKVRLVAPVNNDTTDIVMPMFVWQKQSGAINYQIEIAADGAFTGLIIDKTVGDSFYTHNVGLHNGRHYWRVRAQNDHSIWGDWSDASIWSFLINGDSTQIKFLSSILTIGIPQDLIVENNIAYVADGEAELTMLDVADPARPTIIGNVDMLTDDFAKKVWKNPNDNFVFVADMAGKIQVVDATFPLNPNAIGNTSIGLDQNLEDVKGIMYNDSLFMLSVASGGRNNFRLYHIIYDANFNFPINDPQFSVNEIRLPGDGMGVYYDTMSVYVQYHDTLKADSAYCDRFLGRFVYVADYSAGLWMIDVSASHPFAFPDSVVELIGSPNIVGWGDTPGNALSVQTKGKFAYVADDRAGLEIFRLPDTIPSYDNVLPTRASLTLVSTINTSGRTKDLQIIGDYCFLADASGGLKIINIANPYVPQIVTEYTTPYAYGVWADSSHIYIADRDMGIVIFENLLF